MSAKRKTRAQLEAELEAANKRCADLADALVKQVMAHPVYVSYIVPYTTPSPFYQPYIGTPVQPFSEPWVITTCSTSDKVQS